MAENSIKDIKDFLGVPGKLVEGVEMRDFWASLTDAEKAEFKAADLGNK